MRNSKFDNIKCLLMYMVVIGHIAPQLVDADPFFKSLLVITYLVHMPTFIFVSGLFSKKTINNNLVWKATPYLLLYFVTKLLYWSVIVIRERSFVPFDLLNEGGLPWYALSMFFFHMIAMAVKRFRPSYVLTVSVILSVMVGFCTYNSDFLVWMRTVNLFPFFYLGYVMDADELTEKLRGKAVRIVSCVSLISVVAVCLMFSSKVYLLRPLLTHRNPYTMLERYENYGAPLRLVLFFGITVLIFMLVSISSDKESIFTTIGRRSLGIYVTHNIIIKLLGLCGVFDWLSGLPTPYMYICALAFGTAVFVFCANPLFDRWCRLLFDPSWKLKKTDNISSKR